MWLCNVSTRCLLGCGQKNKSLDSSLNVDIYYNNSFAQCIYKKMQLAILLLKALFATRNIDYIHMILFSHTALVDLQN